MIAIILIGFGVAYAALAIALGLPVLAVIMVELLATAAVGIVFLVLYLARRGDGYGIRDPDPAVREVAWHLILTTAAVVIESLSFILIGVGLGVPEWIFAIVFGVITLVMVHRLTLELRATTVEENMVTSWLKADARNRAARTVGQAVVGLVILPALDAALQVVRATLASGAPFNWREVGATALTSASMGATMAMLAYIHRLKLDPSSVPSLSPPPPVHIDTGPAAVQAPES